MTESSNKMPVTVGASAISEIITTTPETDGASAGRPLATTLVDELARVKSEFAHYKTARYRERTSMRKLVIGMAMKKYGLKPNAGRSGVPKKIADDLRALGIPLDEDTVRKFLQDSSEQAPLQED